MNMISKKINAILFVTIVACAPVHAAEVRPVVVTEEQDIVETGDSVVWYKKRSTHVVAAFAATAIGLYALVVRKNKIAGPMALFMALFCVRKNVQEVKNQDQDNANNEDTKIALVQENTENANNNESDPVNPAVQKADQQEKTPVDLDEKKTENDQSPAIDEVEKNILPTSEAPFHLTAQQYALDALSSIKSGFKNGFMNFVETEDSSRNPYN